MAQTIHLNGGPMHDQRVSVSDYRDHFHIIEPVGDAVWRALQEPSGDDAIGVVSTREGMYSQVQDRPGEFEWDGWRSHD